MIDFALDAHTHCGLTEPFRGLSEEWQQGGIGGGVIFSPVEEIYDRYDPHFTDSSSYRLSRRRVHEYLLQVASADDVFPYFFVWNDFSPIPEAFVGIKWHRHPGEPVYAYGTDQCNEIISEICRRRLPIVLEEEFSNTLSFLKRIGGETVIIIPHMGGLNGGYYKLKKAGVFENEMVWVDTALASQQEIVDFADAYGTERIMFGSDFPFGIPASEKRKVVGCFSGADLSRVLFENLLRLLGRPIPNVE